MEEMKKKNDNIPSGKRLHPSVTYDFHRLMLRAFSSERGERGEKKQKSGWRGKAGSANKPLSASLSHVTAFQELVPNTFSTRVSTYMRKQMAHTMAMPTTNALRKQLPHVFCSNQAALQPGAGGDNGFR